MPGETSIPVDEDVRDIVRAQKRGGEDYNRLLRKMAKQYDPDVSVDLESEGEDNVTAH